jgi:hypothetical protein
MNRLNKPEPYVKTLFAILTTLILSLPAYGDEVEVLMVKATQSDGIWNFDVTIHHPDANSGHMMDSIALFSPDEVQLTTADIPMPSIGAKNVTAQLNNIAIPEGVEYIIIRGHCSTDGWTHEGIIIALM